MSRSQRQSNMVRTHTPADRLPSDFQVPAFLADLRSLFPSMIPDESAADALAAQIEAGAMVADLDEVA